ncbi:RagB/SusD family nutrient uptake outer membrane protein [Wenyingzhuangia sp. IMCC45574]
MKVARIIILSMLMVSCDSVLDETPDNRTFIDSADKIAELLVAAYPNGAYVPFLEPMTDNAGDKSPVANTDNSNGERINREMYFWRDISDTNLDTPTNYWNRAYTAIAQANQALVSIEELGGGEELQALKGEALLCRAYAHFMLVSIYSKAYNPSTADVDLGIPYVTEPETILFGAYERGTVADVYAKIEDDLLEGIALVDNEYQQPKYHFTPKAAHALASRFYLNKGDWDEVIAHSNLALGGDPLAVVRNWANYRTQALTYSQIQIAYTSTIEPANLLLVSSNSTYDRFHFNARYQLTLDIASELFQGNPVGKSWSRRFFGSSDLFFNVPKIREYFKVTNQAAGTGDTFVAYVLLSTDEVLCNRAEAYAMKGQLDLALADLNTIYQVNTQGYVVADDAFTVDDVNAIFEVLDPQLYTPFYDIPAASLAMINAVLTTKRTLFYNDGLRWFDIKRHDMVVNHRDVFGNEYILTKGDNRKAIQIPEAAKALGIDINPR